MKSGTVQNLVAGGLGYSADISSTVTTANIIIKCETDFNCPTFFRFSTSKHLTQQSNY